VSLSQPLRVHLESPDDHDSEREDLTELVGSRGWARFVAYATREYKGDGYFNRMNAALREGGFKPHALQDTALAIDRLLSWPKNRVSDLKGVTE
jgi:hypothetical protein